MAYSALDYTYSQLQVAMEITSNGYVEDEDKSDEENRAWISTIQDLAEAPGEKLISKFKSDVLP